MTEHDHDAVRVLRQAADRYRYPGTVDVADVMRTGASRRRERAAHRTVVAGALTTAVVVAVVVAGVGLAVAPEQRAAISPSGVGEPVADLSLLARPPVEGDEIPAVNDGVADEAEPYGMVEGSTRLVVEADGVGYFAGVDAQGEVCVLVHLQAQSHVASSCAPPERFADAGVWVSASGYSGVDVTGLLLPDHLRESAAGDLDGSLEHAGIGAQGGARLLAPNLLAVVKGSAPATSPTTAVGTPTTKGSTGGEQTAVPGTAPVDVTGTTWELVAATVDGDAVQIPAGAELTLRVDGDQVGVGAVCNGYVASWSADGGRVTVGALSGTRKGCSLDVQAVEQAYKGALPRVTAAAREGERLRLTGDGVDLLFASGG